MKKTDPTARLKAQAAKRRKRAALLHRHQDDHLAHVKAHGIAQGAFPLGLGTNPAFIQAKDVLERDLRSRGIPVPRPVKLYRVFFKEAFNPSGVYVASSRPESVLSFVATSSNARFQNLVTREIEKLELVDDLLLHAS